MAKLIQKSGYIKSGGTAAGYMKYIATRENVEKFNGNGPATENQKKLIAELLRDFPDAKELFEYEDYTATPTFGNASAFITMALDANAHSMQATDGYMKYIATRPRVERQGEHGLFSDSDSVSLPAAIEELNGHDGRIWTFIYSLRREDAARLGYDNASNWRQLILSQKKALADAMRIPAEHLRWYAAFHDEGHHPHIHMMVWSDDPKQEYLSRSGIVSMRSAVANEIFRDELYALYKEKDLSYKEVTEKAQQVMRELIAQMESAVCDSPIIAQMMADLSKELEAVAGKKVYSYLKKPIKEKVDAIVDELAKVQPVADCYSVWNELRDKLESYYKTKPREHLPLSQQKEFRVIKNMVIREAENIRLGVHTFEDEDMQDEPEEDDHDGRASNTKRLYELAADYRKAKVVLTNNTLTLEEKRGAVDTLERLWHDGFTTAAHQLGKVWRDGLCDPPDEKQAEKWFRCAAEVGLGYSQYALGKLLQGQNRISEAVSWYEKAAAQGNQYAHYRMGKLYLSGDGVPKDVERAVEYLTASAKLGNQYAQYALGKLYLMGRDVPRDEEAARKWLTASAEQGYPYAQFFLERIGQFRDPSVLLAATRLLHHLANTFRDNAQPPSNPAGLRIDSKRRRKLMQKRLAMGHKPDDHEEHLQTPR
ncbi:MAG: SEL1-like repeat protein [Oscillospiraceae bacterium]|nr:SEL1-like repeat protein [Oscillospiraceae bacterium]